MTPPDRRVGLGVEVWLLLGGLGAIVGGLLLLGLITGVGISPDDAASITSTPPPPAITPQLDAGRTTVGTAVALPLLLLAVWLIRNTNWHRDRPST